MKTTKINFLTILIAAAMAGMTGCGNPESKKTEDSSPATATSTAEILGAGATFPYPLYSKMFDEYNKLTGVKVNYQSIGSGGGIKQLMSKTVDFGASDAFLSDDQLKQMSTAIIHIPICLGANVITYNLPG